MNTNHPPKYDFSNPLFVKHPQYIRYAREQMEMYKLLEQSDCITWEVKETTGPLQIPSVYHVHYHLKSIVGIDAGRNPIYGNHHILELSIPNRYPIEPFGIRMVTDLWHPNIKWDGKFKGRVCANAREFGRTYMLYQLVLRVGEILQYKNYLAEFVEPFPEDAMVAEWVREFAEPRDIVNRKKNIFVDDTPLLRPRSHSEEEATDAPEPPEEARPVESVMEETPLHQSAEQISPETQNNPSEKRGILRLTPRVTTQDSAPRPKIIIGKRDAPQE